MKIIKLTSKTTGGPIYINVDAIGHFYSYRDKEPTSVLKPDEHMTVVGVTTHNNGGFKVKETVEQIKKKLDSMK